MTTFLFNSAPFQNFPTGNYYAVVVTAIPLITHSLRSDLAEPLGAAPVALTGKIYTATKLSFNNFNFPTFNYTSQLYGMVILQQIGAAPAPTDPLISYTSFRNSVGQNFIAPVGTYTIPVRFGPAGAITINNVYRYTSGAYITGANGGFPFGAIYLMGTKNNTIPYASPEGSSIFQTLGASSNAAANWLTDRAAGNGSFESAIGINFGTGRIRVGVFAIRDSATHGGGDIDFNLYGSNDLAGGFSVGGINNAANWTALAAGVISGGANWYGVAATDQVSYWKYLKLTAPFNQTNFMTEIEFYESTIESISQDFA
jgi:hypothetical protein